MFYCIEKEKIDLACLNSCIISPNFSSFLLNGAGDSKILKNGTLGVDAGGVGSFLFLESFSFSDGLILVGV